MPFNLLLCRERKFVPLQLPTSSTKESDLTDTDTQDRIMHNLQMDRSDGNF